MLLILSTDIPLIQDKHFVYAQTGDLTTDLTLRLWNLYILKICLRSIIVPSIKKEYRDILDVIANYLDVHLDHNTLTITRMRIEYES